MSASEIVNEIEQGAKNVGLSVAALCRRAQVANSTLTRWKDEKTSPNVATVERLRSEIRKAAAEQEPKGSVC